MRARASAGVVSIEAPPSSAIRHRMRRHRPDLEHQDEREEAHLGIEDAVVEVVTGSLLEAAERPQQTSADPQQGGHAPQSVGEENATQAFGVQRGAQSALTCPNSS